MKNATLIGLTGFLITFNACKKDEVEETPILDNATTRSEILQSISSNVISASYNDMMTHSITLFEISQSFQTEASQANLDLLRIEWRAIRSSSGATEGFLFGPVASENIDPRIDTWPVNNIDLDSILATQATYSESYVDQLEDALKGFHPIEYLIFGINGNKEVAEFTEREKLFLVALAANLKTLCTRVNNQWASPSSAYRNSFNNAGLGSTDYSTHKAAFEELVNAMAGICDEVANGKIGEPFLLADPSLEESPFSKNSLTDFKNNMRSVQNIYTGKYVTDGKGIEDFVRVYNLSLDTKIKTQISQAITALDGITMSFGEAITLQPTQVQNAINQINTLKGTLETELLQLVQQRM